MVTSSVAHSRDARMTSATALLARIFAPLAVFVNNCIAPLEEYGVIKSSLLRRGHWSVAICIFAAVVTNHIRRVLVPWAGQFMWYHAVTGMKLARSSPHHYLEEATSFEAYEIVFWIGQILFVEAIRRRLLAFIVQCHRRKKQRAQDEWREKVALSEIDEDTSSALEESEVVMDLCCVLYLASDLSTLERVYTESCWCASQVYALTRLYFSSRDGAAASLLFGADIKAVIQRLMFVRWLLQRFLPNASMTIKAAASGGLALPALHFIIWRGTAYLVRYSNKYFIFLELSDMLVTFGWMLMGICLVLCWKVQDTRRKHHGR